jgi:6-phosphofructokinase 1
LRLSAELKQAGCTREIRETILGHLQRGGIPIAYDRILASQYGVKAFELVKEGKFGQMVAYHHPNVVSVPIAKVIAKPNLITMNSNVLKTARGLGICFGD